MNRSSLSLLSLVSLASACTSLGPMPSTTGVRAVPIGQPGLEVSGGVMPGYYLSNAAGDHHEASMHQLTALVEPDRWVGVPGLIVGVRGYGDSGETPIEPYVGYRRQVSDALAVAGLAYGTRSHASAGLASYHAARGGAELALDARLGPPAWITVHVQGALSGTAVSAGGTYCVNAQGSGVDCDDDHPAANTIVDGKLSGVYGAATGTLALDFGHATARGAFLARLGFLVTYGRMPALVDGRQRLGNDYTALGLQLTLGAGAGR